MNSTELELEVCHQKSYASWHGSMVYSLFRIFEKVSFGTYYWLFSSARALNLISLFILFVTSKKYRTHGSPPKNDYFLLVILEH